MENSQLIIGQTSGYALLPVRIDTDGHLQIDVLSGVIGIEGYYNAAWRKAPIPWGASDVYGQNWQNLSLPAGASNQDSGALVANAFTVITQWSFMVVSAAVTVTATLARMDGGVGGTQRTLQSWYRPTSGIWNSWNGFVACKDSDILRVLLTGMNLNDDLYVSVNGYTIALNL